MTLRESLQHVIEGRNLGQKEAHEAMKELMGGSAPTELIAGFLAALRVKGETVDEISGFAQAMRDACLRIRPSVRGVLVDTCSTGGAPVKTFNVGTTAAFVAAAGGAYVAKHGNRSFNRPTGSADLLEALGVNLNLTPPQVQRVIEEQGIGFLFSPQFHPAMKFAAPARKALGVRTVFNLLGPIANPAQVETQVLGVYDGAWVEPVAHVLNRLGLRHAIVLHGEGSDEPNLNGATSAAEVKDGNVRTFQFVPEEFGLSRSPFEDYGPLAPPEAAKEARRILGGGDGARATVVRFSGGLALYVSGRAPSIQAGIDRAQAILMDGSGLQKLDAFVAASKKAGASAA